MNTTFHLDAPAHPVQLHPEMPVFANPLGLLALLGIPAVLAIHFLQRKAIELPVSTLFLLERTQRDAASGRRFERIIPSIPLWMQLLAVLLLAWILAEPRYQKARTVQRVAVVLDSSASMEVFKKQAVNRLLAEIPTFQGLASQVELTVIESAPNRPRLYAGASLTDLAAALGSWRPLDGLTDPTQAIRLARSLVSRDGTVIYLTDTPAESLPFNATQIAVGDAVENVGFTGVSFATEEGSLVWRALVRNYGKSSADRTWSLVTESGATEPRPFHLEPGSLVTLQSVFPAGVKHARVVLSPDRFALDDTLPLVAPAPKPISLFTATSPAFASLTEKLLRALEAAVPSQDASTADLAIVSYDPLDPVLPPGNSIVFVEDATRSGAYLKGGILAEPNPLMDNLNWQSLLVRETLQLERLETDSVLLWQEKRALIFLRNTPATPEHPASRQLCFNFDLRLSNAANQPAFIVLLHRFAESVRAAKIAPTSSILETNQPIRVTTAPTPEPKTLITDLTGKPFPGAIAPNQAPPFPGFLMIRQGDHTLLDAAVYFADTREADFSACGKADPADQASASALERHTMPDPWWRIWILVLLAALLVSWRFNSRPVPA